MGRTRKGKREREGRREGAYRCRLQVLMNTSVPFKSRTPPAIPEPPSGKASSSVGRKGGRKGGREGGKGDQSERWSSLHCQ